MVKMATMTFCLAVVCLVPLLQQRGRRHDVYNLLVVVLWMLFAFAGNMYIPDLQVVSASTPARVVAMLAWLVLSWFPAAGCIRLLRRAARVRV